MDIPSRKVMHMVSGGNLVHDGQVPFAPNILKETTDDGFICNSAKLTL
jgi:hypothetical protein